MHVTVKVCLVNEEGQRFMGEGPYQLLCLVAEKGSIRQAALDMGMSYTKAHRLLKQLESNVGADLFVKYIGGSQRGGTVLTERAQRLLKDYHQLCLRVEADANLAFKEFSQCFVNQS